jgi:hypothetical protein
LLYTVSPRRSQIRRRRFFPHPNIFLARLDQFPCRERQAIAAYEERERRSLYREALRQIERELFRVTAQDDLPRKTKPKRPRRQLSGIKMPAWSKHAGKPIETVVARDYRYVDWLRGEPWFSERFPELAGALRTERQRRRRRAYIDRQDRLVLPNGSMIAAPYGFWRAMRRAFKCGGDVVFSIEPDTSAYSSWGEG